MGKGGVGLQASVCLEEFENYLMNVKKASVSLHMSAMSGS